MTSGHLVPLRTQTDLHTARRRAAQAAADARLTAGHSAACELIATELATNVLQHAGNGHLLINIIETSPAGPDGRDGPDGGVQIVTVDNGPGIGNVQACLTDGYSTGHSLGGGLGTCRRASSVFDLISAPGDGTVVLAQIGPAPGRDQLPTPLPGGPLPLQGGPLQLPGGVVPLLGGVVTPHPNEEVSGDGWWAQYLPAQHHGGHSGHPQMIMAVVDGLGHGPLAADASRRALDVLQAAVTPANNESGRPGARVPIPSTVSAVPLQHPPAEPAEYLARLHEPLRQTRGTVAGIAQFHLPPDLPPDGEAAQVRFAGVGNIRAQLQVGSQTRSLASRPGVVGASTPARPRGNEPAPWSPPGLLALTSDGIDPFTLSRYRHLHLHHPAAAAALIWRDHHRQADDATVVIAVTSPDAGPDAWTVR